MKILTENVMSIDIDSLKRHKKSAKLKTYRDMIDYRYTSTNSDVVAARRG